MAVKAVQTITLMKALTVDSLTMYYAQVNTGSSAPAKPTTLTPSSPWSTNEPTIDLAKDLYATIRTLFSDGTTFEYSNPQKYSSYEAAKSAYNVASTANTNATTALNKATVISDTAPTNTECLWLDTDSGMLKQYVWDQDEQTGSWVVVNDFTQITGPMAETLNEVKQLAEQVDSDLRTYQQSISETIQLNVSQTAEEWTATFNGYKEIAEGYEGALNTYIQETEKWIKMKNGTIFLGDEDSDFTLEIQNDRIEICYKGNPISRWNTELFFSKEVLTKKLVLRDASWGNNGFGWVANANGSLSFRKIPLTTAETTNTL